MALPTKLPMIVTKLPVIVKPKPYSKKDMGGYLLNDVKFSEDLFI
jgi:hypothetical protein